MPSSFQAKETHQISADHSLPHKTTTGAPWVLPSLTAGPYPASLPPTTAAEMQSTVHPLPRTKPIRGLSSVPPSFFSTGQKKALKKVKSGEIPPTFGSRVKDCRMWGSTIQRVSTAGGVSLRRSGTALTDHRALSCLPAVDQAFRGEIGVLGPFGAKTREAANAKRTGGTDRTPPS